ncbi:poly-gamma-glutamate hydrolase family protein [Priestia aryabhattai]|uniref:poly-gamma-glutamate hydrolase family protein n=1 Tax=Priestia TaxID=2800373 RepID=UPI0008DE5FAD|nr:poly-gamma-glutamate hydrolase family protein [Priestia aryabhattai]MBX9967512.1 poly-gamma-glutamate hydrolase family protein [Priestia aryabhattai]MBZ6487000.1 poly-gamma-glutamate hydrolase family protein [Priestia aryabhattai]MDH3113848.1 poly-gamma-glutamate hydrolase family protein [Priestia aryabhattai]MDH3127249.1 poly-gamma-glutamate hydrolase family protein [Priestia aryabhattai]MDH3132513.1 poly-gamma-glutamate hydrolase family protein [Priestia aryabhattai]
MRDVYQSFQELSQCERGGIDYEIKCVIRRREIVVLAIHGGTMEIGTEEVAEKIAENLNATVYVFKTLKTENPFELHVTSANYDEEMARHLVKKSAVTISLHGAYSDVCTTYIGGRDEELEKAVRHALSGFPISETPVHLKGVSPRNIANSNQRHKGLQLEITTPQYEQLLQDEQLFNEYVNAIVSAVNSVM